MDLFFIIILTLWILAFVSWIITIVIPKTRKNLVYLYPLLAMQIFSLVLLIYKFLTM